MRLVVAMLAAIGISTAALAAGQDAQSARQRPARHEQQAAGGHAGTKAVPREEGHAQRGRPEAAPRPDHIVRVVERRRATPHGAHGLSGRQPRHAPDRAAGGLRHSPGPTRHASRQPHAATGPGHHAATPARHPSRRPQSIQHAPGSPYRAPHRPHYAASAAQSASRPRHPAIQAPHLGPAPTPRAPAAVVPKRVPPRPAAVRPAPHHRLVVDARPAPSKRAPLAPPHALPPILS